MKTLLRCIAVLALAAAPLCGNVQAASPMDAAMAAAKSPAPPPPPQAKPVTAPAPVAAPAPSATASKPACPPGASQGPAININEADVDTLDTLFGIGPATAKSIIDERGKSLFENPDEIAKRGIMSAAAVSCIRPRLVIANLNTSSADLIAKVLPGIGINRAQAIVEGRKKRPYRTLADLVKRVDNVTQSVADGLNGLVAF